MKKLFTMAVGALLVLGLAACNSGSKKEESVSYSDTVYEDKGEIYGLWGPKEVKINGVALGDNAWGGDKTAEAGKMTATSIANVAKVSKDIANKLVKVEAAGKLKGLYVLEKVELGHEAYNGEKKGGYKADGTYVEVDAIYASKLGHYTYDELTGNYAATQWIPSPEGYSNALSPETLWMPSHTDKKDEHQLDHNANPIILTGAGEYTYVLAVYKGAYEDSYFGVGAVQTKKLDEYVPPVALSEYALPGAWNGWDNSATKETSAMIKQADNSYKLTLTVTAGQAGRVVEAGSWNTAASFADVTTGADLVQVGEGTDDNFAFKAAGTYEVTFTVSPKAITIVAK